MHQVKIFHFDIFDLIFLGSKMIPWDVFMIILMMVGFKYVENVDQLMVTAISNALQPILIALKKYFRYELK